MLSCFKCGRNTERKNLKVVKTNKRKLLLLSKFVVCDGKKSRYQRATSYWIIK